MSDSRRYAIRRFLGFVCLLLVISSVLVLLGWPPTRRWAGSDGVRAMLAGASVSWIASVIGGLPVLIAGLRGRTTQVQQIIGSLAIRFLLVLLGTFYVLLSGLAAKTPFIVWIGISYLLLLPIDVWYVLKSNLGAAAGD